MKKIFSIIAIIFVVLFGLNQKALADATINTGDAGAQAVFVNCVNTTSDNSTTNGCQEPSNGGVTPIPSPTPGGGGNNNNGGGENPNNNNGGGGGNGSNGPCTDSAPGAPTSLTAVAGPGSDQVTLSWLPPSGTAYTYFLISYSDDPTTQKWGNPNVGSGTSYTVSGLGAGPYYFWVAAVNGCMPGPMAGPESVGGGLVLGTETGPTVTPTPSPVKAVEGLKTIAAGICTTCIWWPFLALEALGFVLYQWRENKKKRKNIVLMVAIPVVAYVLFLFFNRSCLTWGIFIRSTYFFCKYFLLLDGVLFAVYLLWRRFRKPLAKAYKKYSAKLK